MQSYYDTESNDYTTCRSRKDILRTLTNKYMITYDTGEIQSLKPFTTRTFKTMQHKAEVNNPVSI